MKNNNLSLLDKDQVAMRMFDGDHDAQRVVMVGDTGKQIAESIKDSLKDIKIEVNNNTEDILKQFIKELKPNTDEKWQATMLPQIKYEVIEVPKIVKELEIKEIEKVILVPEYRTIEIEKPIIVPEVKIVEIEKQVVVKEYKEIPKIFIWLFSAQILLSFISLILNHK